MPGSLVHQAAPGSSTDNWKPVLVQPQALTVWLDACSLFVCTDLQCMMLQISLSGISSPTIQLSSFLASTIFSFSEFSITLSFVLPVVDLLQSHLFAGND